jgi:hypothetical protein
MRPQQNSHTELELRRQVAQRAARMAIKKWRDGVRVFASSLHRTVIFSLYVHLATVRRMTFDKASPRSSPALNIVLWFYWVSFWY